MDTKKCDKHNKKVLVICIYYDCVEPLLCNDCFKDHETTHIKSYLSYEENIDLEMRIKEENFNLVVILNNERK